MCRWFFPMAERPSKTGGGGMCDVSVGVRPRPPSRLRVCRWRSSLRGFWWRHWIVIAHDNHFPRILCNFLSTLKKKFTYKHALLFGIMSVKQIHHHFFMSTPIIFNCYRTCVFLFIYQVEKWSLLFIPLSSFF